MKKFFLFRKEEIGVSSVTASDTGKGLSVIALPAESFAFASAARGYVVIAFNDATLYEESNLTDGESIEKTTIKIPCEVGEEVNLVESILSFMSRESGKSIMKFDAVDSKSTFSSVSFNSKIESKVKVNPTKRLTGVSSTQTFLGTSGTLGVDVASNEIAGIDFGIAENKPVLDFNHEGLSAFAHGATITSWANAGTGGASYDIASIVGTPGAYTTTSVSGISQKVARIDTAEHFIVPTFEQSEDYTLYMVYNQAVNEAHPIYGDGDGICFGATIGQFVEDPVSGEIAKLRPSAYGNFSVRHESRTGAPARASVTDELNGTVGYVYPNLDEENQEKILVFVIRRDKFGNMYMYNKHGDFVSFIEAKTAKSLTDQGVRYTDATDGRTDGDLKIERLGTVADITADDFGGMIGRFGVIGKDIGTAACTKLATDLYNFYKI